MLRPSLNLGGFAGLGEGEARVKFEQQGPKAIPAQRRLAPHLARGAAPR